VAAPLVTIGLPCFNGANHLQEALDALIAQDYDNLEILVADNASTDGSLDIARAAAAADHRVTLLESAENHGAAWNYNRLVEKASGDYFKWAAHDDICRSDYISACVEALEANPDAVLAYPRTLIIDGEGEVTSSYDERMPLDFAGDIKRGAALLWRVRLCNAVFGVIRIETLRATPLIQSFDSSDIALLAELALRGRFIQTDERSFLRRRHSEGSRKANTDSASVAAWFAPNARRGRSRPLLRSYQRSASAWAPNPIRGLAARAMFATVGSVVEVRWHRRSRRRMKAAAKVETS